MESQLQQPEYIDTTSQEVIEVSEPTIESASEQKWQQIGDQISDFLAQLPDYISRFFNAYKQPIINIALIVAAIVAVRVLLAVLNALNGIPLVETTFKLVGISYSVWFANRYLLKASKRKEVSRQMEALKQQMLGEQ